MTIDRQVTGQRTFDVNSDGTAHYGLIPDWVEDVRLAGGNEIARDMYRGAEAYLQTWERAWRPPRTSCLAKRAKISRRGIGAITIRRPAFNVLKKGGQPAQRKGATYNYCVKGGRGKVAAGSAAGRRWSRAPPGAIRPGGSAWAIGRRASAASPADSAAGSGSSGRPRQPPLRLCGQAGQGPRRRRRLPAGGPHEKLLVKYLEPLR